MENAKSILTIALFITAGFVGCKQTDNSSDFITIDPTANHPNKELILQDFMDVEYIPLETNDEFVTQGGVMAIGKKYILVKNWTDDGDIFVFDRVSGKGIRKINRKGQGAEEYTYINSIILDEEADEIFVNSTQTKKIYVYDLTGNFKRSFEHAPDAEYMDVYNYDKYNLVCYDISGYFKNGENRNKDFYHAIISKQDGSITRNITIPFETIKAPAVEEGPGFAVTSVQPIVPHGDNFLLVETSSDTVYSYATRENKLSPFIVKKPTLEPEMFLIVGTLTDRYYFMQTIKKEFDFTTGRGFPTTDLMYDKQENAVYTATVLNADYVKKQEVNMTMKPVTNEVATYQVLPAHKLIETYNNDGLKGKLKDIAAELDEESNPVIMLMRQKK